MLKFKIGDIAVFETYGNCLIIGISPDTWSCAVLVETGVILNQSHIDNGYKNWNIDPINVGKRFYNMSVSEILSVIKHKNNKKINCRYCVR